MRFDEALNAVFNHKRLAMPRWEGRYIHMLHNTIATSDGNNYRPTVTELNSSEWVILHNSSK